MACIPFYMINAFNRCVSLLNCMKTSSSFLRLEDVFTGRGFQLSSNDNESQSNGSDNCGANSTYDGGTSLTFFVAYVATNLHPGIIIF